MKSPDSPAQTTLTPLSSVFLLTLPVAAAYIPLGATLGIYLVASGLDWYWAPISALIIFAGSIEFLVVSFIITGTSLPIVAWTTFIVNFRHIFYALSFPYQRLKNPLQRYYGLFALTDETYAITSAGEGSKLDSRGITMLQLISYFYWISSALAGALIGTLIPPEITGFEFALTAMFTILAIEAIKSSQSSDSFSLIAYALIATTIAILSEHYLIENSFLISGILSYLFFIVLSYLRTPKESSHAI